MFVINYAIIQFSDDCHTVYKLMLYAMFPIATCYATIVEQLLQNAFLHTFHTFARI